MSKKNYFEDSREVLELIGNELEFEGQDKVILTEWVNGEGITISCGDRLMDLYVEQALQLRPMLKRMLEHMS